MSGADIGIRVSLVGGKEVATEATLVAGSIREVGLAVEQAGAKMVAMSGAINGETASMGKLTDVTEVNTKVTETNSAALMRRFADMGKWAYAGAAGFVYESAKMALGYEKTTTQISATANISEDAAKKISSAFLHTNGTVTYSAQQMATAFQPIAGQLSEITHGAVNAHSSMMLMNASMNLATASGEQLATSTGSVAQVLQSYSEGLSQADNVSNVLFNTSRLTANSTSAVASSVDRLHMRLGQVMPSLADTSGLLLDLATKGGVNGTRGLNMVSGALSTLLTNSPTVSSMLNKLGLSVNNFIGPNGKFLGMANAISVLNPRLASLNQHQQQLAETSLFGQGAAEAMGKTVLAGAAAYESARAAATRANAVQEAANKVTNSLGGQWDLLMKDVHNAGVVIGSFLLPKLLTIGKWFMQNKPVMLGIIFIIGTLMVAAMAAWAVEATKSSALFKFLFAQESAEAEISSRKQIAAMGRTTAMWMFNAAKQIAAWGGVAAAATATFIAENLASLGIIAGVALIGAAVVYMAYHWKQTWDDIKNWAEDAWHFVTRIWDGVESWFKGIVHDVANIGKGMWDFIYNEFVKIANKIIVAYDDTLGWIPGMHVNSLHTIGGVPASASGGAASGSQGAPMMASGAAGTTGGTGPMIGEHVSMVTPGSTNTSAVPAQVIANNGGGEGQHHVIQLVVDRKVLSELVYKEMRSNYARR